MDISAALQMVAITAFAMTGVIAVSPKGIDLFSACVMGIITATAVIPEFAELTWMFWMVLSGILLLASIAFTVGQGGGGYE